jgi:hypothetical protein
MSAQMKLLALGLMVVAGAHPTVARPARTIAGKVLPVRQTVADAEAEGAVYPHGPAREHAPISFSGHGPAQRTCTIGPTTLSASSPWEIRSGDFVIGGQIGGGRPPSVRVSSKIWWSPYHNPAEVGTTLLVRGARLGVRGDTIRFEQPRYAWPAGGLKTDSFFPSSIIIPHAGKWLLIATAGYDWGCFILSTGV